MKEGAKVNTWQLEEEGVLSAGLGVTTVFHVWAPKTPSGFVNLHSYLIAFGSGRSSAGKESHAETL